MITLAEPDPYLLTESEERPTKQGASMGDSPLVRPLGLLVREMIAFLRLPDPETLWGGRRRNGNFVAVFKRWSAAMTIVRTAALDVDAARSVRQ